MKNPSTAEPTIEYSRTRSIQGPAGISTFKPRASLFKNEPKSISMSEEFSCEKGNYRETEGSASKSKSDYILLEKFTGYIDSLFDEGFIAIMKGSAESEDVIETEFYYEEIPEDSIKLIEIGASVTWTIGQRFKNKSIVKESTVYIPDLPPADETEIESSKQSLESIFAQIDWK